MPDTRTPVHARRSFILAAATALMCALAGGAVWCLLSLYQHGNLVGFAFVVAAVVAWSLRAHGFAGSIGGAAFGAGCVVLASVYAFCLQAIARIASMLGIPMRTALVRIDAAMTLDLARVALDAGSTIIVCAAAALAAVLVLLRRRA